MTQEYTPVEWVDETPTVPGTIINKARLDQMQTAHHFADGFEEVDAVPTDDPGVDYHKIVLCTLNGVIYRWNGTEWVVASECKQYIHDQAQPSATWTVHHNLNKHVQVQVQDTAGTLIVGRITETDTDTVVIEFNAATSGVAIIE